MRHLNPKIFGMALLGFNLACAGEGHSGTNPQTAEVNSMKPSRSDHQSSEAHGSFESEAHGRQELEINVDVAATTVVFVPMSQDFKVSWKKGNSCDQIEVRETPEGLEVKHVDRDGSCGESTVDVWINEKISTKFNGGSGFLTVKGTSKLLGHAKEISAIVMAGNIRTEDRRIELDRQWAQATARYLDDKKSGLNIRLSLGAGSILFSN